MPLRRSFVDVRLRHYKVAAPPGLAVDLRRAGVRVGHHGSLWHSSTIATQIEIERELRMADG